MFSALNPMLISPPVEHSTYGAPEDRAFIMPSFFTLTAPRKTVGLQLHRWRGVTVDYYSLALVDAIDWSFPTF